MSVSAYIMAGQTVIPALLPTQPMLDTARQLGIPETDLFSVDIPSGMSRHVRASLLVASTQLASLYASSGVTLRLEDSSGRTVTLEGLYPRPPQPFFWGQQGGVVLVELVDHRWWWRFSSTKNMDGSVVPSWSSDGRWQVDDDFVASMSDLIDQITFAAESDNLVMPVGFFTDRPVLRRVADMFGTSGGSLALVLDAMAVATRQMIVYTGSETRFISTTTLKTQYDGAMYQYGLAYRGGMQPVNGAAGGSDVLVNLWNQDGYKVRCPIACSPLLPRRTVEGQTVYDNCKNANTPATSMNFVQHSMYVNGANATFARAPENIGVAYVPDASTVCLDGTGEVLNGAPGWNVSTLESYIRLDYASRYSNIPFGRTVLAGWIPWYSGPTSTFGQIGMVSYRGAIVDGEWAPFTVTEAREDDWIFGLDGSSISDPSKLVTGKGLNNAYRNCIGATIIDAAPPNTRVFPAKITGSEQFDNWRWAYSFEEVEPNPTILTGGNPWVSMGDYARTGIFKAKNMAEAGNTYLGVGNAGNVVAPGVTQANYANATITALPISTGTVVEMVEQFPTVYVGQGANPEVTPPRFWFSMPNAVRVECTS